MGVTFAIGKAGRAGLVAAGLAVAGFVAYACADVGEMPTWELAKDAYDPGGNGAFLTPGNDTRVNLLLLIADRHAQRPPTVRREGPPLVLFPWKVLSAAARPTVPETEDGEWREPSRCQTRETGAAAFGAAVRANSRITPDEKQRLEAARAAFVPDCSGAGAPPPAVAVSSPAGQAFAAYLKGAGDFYGGRFDSAESTFESLAQAPDPWLRETASYMVARNALNRAQQTSFDEYGSLAEPERRDLAGLAAAGAAFETYLETYPKGLYAASARGLTRRVAWLGGKGEALAAAIDRQLSSGAPFDGAANATALSQEIDLTLLSGGSGGAARNPLILAVVDLQRMRCVDDYDTPAPDCRPRLGREELERQAPLFEREPALFGYLRAAEAFFVRGQAREVLKLIPDSARQERFTYLEFSRQMLRGMALDSAGDRNARAFWLSLFGGAVQPYQREALELALALHDERTGGLARIFAPDSKVRHPVVRQLLLEHVAGPDLLRRQAIDRAAPKLERDVAAYVLLAKGLRRGFYRDFLGDVRLVPPEAPNEGYHSSARYYDAHYNAQLEAPPLGRFGPGARVGDAGCPALVATVRRLADAPRAIGPRLCLAEFFRVNGFDNFELDAPLAGRGLASSKPQFPGEPYQRLEVYKSIIADPAASGEERALALNRAVRCYAPVGNNSCGGAEVGLEQRRAWFSRLKRDHAASRWARSLEHYW